MSESIVLSLISHTNIGKTTLTRTLLRRDVGEVRDATHVTEESERFVMLEAEGDTLILWDTPGFGPVGKLLKRLKQEGGAVGWLMHEVVDRVFDRALYSSLEAAKNVRAEADVVLYLVNAREEPEDAGYVEGELQLLDALGKPVIMILNQVPGESMTAAGEAREHWRKSYEKHACLKDVLLLDAFTRTWLQELRMLDAVSPLLPESRQKVLARLRTRFVAERRATFEACAGSAGEILWFAAHQSPDPEDKGEPKRLFARLLSELQTRLDDYLDLLTRRHGLEAEGRAQLEADIEQVTGLVGGKMEEERTGLIAGAVTSAGTGLIADILSGGMTFGGGMILGFLGGYLGGFSFAKAMNFINRKGAVVWKTEALSHFYSLLLSYYLLAALHGRGKGKLAVEKPAAFIMEAVANLESESGAAFEALVAKSRKEQTQMSAWLRDDFLKLFENHVNSVLSSLSLTDSSKPYN
ncbi:MAG: 50S ribosome-binding GTPase [Acidobacteriota bacterium]|nr:50S ribosome-binding GTPase [Acidobacteriota bacterium]